MPDTATAAVRTASSGRSPSPSPRGDELMPEGELHDAERDFMSFLKVLRTKIGQMSWFQLIFILTLVLMMMAGNAIQIIGLNFWLRTFPGGGHAGSYTILTTSGLIFAAIFLVALVVYTYAYKPDMHFARDSRGWILLIGIGFMDTFNSFMNIYAANHTPEVMQALFQSLMPIFTCILTKLILSDPRDYYNRWVYMSFGLTALGVFVAVAPDFISLGGGSDGEGGDADVGGDVSSTANNTTTGNYDTMLWCLIFSLSVPLTALMNVWQTKYMEDYTEVTLENPLDLVGYMGSSDDGVSSLSARSDSLQAIEEGGGGESGGIVSASSENISSGSLNANAATNPTVAGYTYTAASLNTDGLPVGIAGFKGDNNTSGGSFGGKSAASVSNASIAGSGSSSRAAARRSPPTSALQPFRHGEKFAGMLDKNHHTAHHGIFMNTRDDNEEGDDADDLLGPRRAKSSTGNGIYEHDDAEEGEEMGERKGLLSSHGTHAASRTSSARKSVKFSGVETLYDGNNKAIQRTTSGSSCGSPTHHHHHANGTNGCNERPFRGEDTIVKLVMLAGGTGIQAIMSLCLLPADALPWWGGASSVAEAAEHFVSNIDFMVTDKRNAMGAMFYSSGFIFTYIGGAYLNQYSPTLCSMVGQLSSPMTALVLILVPAWNLEASSGAWYWSLIAVILLTAATVIYSVWEEITTQEMAYEQEREAVRREAALLVREQREREVAAATATIGGCNVVGDYKSTATRR